MQDSERIETKSTTIWMDKEGLLRLKIKHGAEVDLQEMKTIFAAYKKLGCRKNKALQLIEGAHFFTIKKNALGYAAEQGKHFFIASATVYNSLAIRILFNFFTNFYKPLVPLRIFMTKGEAMDWLRTFNQRGN